MKLLKLTEDMDIQPSIITYFLSSLVISYGFLDIFKFKNIEQDTGWYFALIVANFLILKTVPGGGLFYLMYLSIEHLNKDI